MGKKRFSSAVSLHDASLFAIVAGLLPAALPRGLSPGAFTILDGLRPSLTHERNVLQCFMPYGQCIGCNLQVSYLAEVEELYMDVRNPHPPRRGGRIVQPDLRP